MFVFPFLCFLELPLVILVIMWLVQQSRSTLILFVYTRIPLAFLRENRQFKAHLFAVEARDYLNFDEIIF